MFYLERSYKIYTVRFLSQEEAVKQCKMYLTTDALSPHFFLFLVKWYRNPLLSQKWSYPSCAAKMKEKLHDLYELF